MSLYLQTADIEKYVGVSIHLVKLYKTRLKNLDSAVNALRERIAFLENLTNGGSKVNEAYIEMVQLISSEVQGKEASDEQSITLCNALEKVIFINSFESRFSMKGRF